MAPSSLPAKTEVYECLRSNKNLITDTQWMSKHNQLKNTACSKCVCVSSSSEDHDIVASPTSIAAPTR